MTNTLHALVDRIPDVTLAHLLIARERLAHSADRPIAVPLIRNSLTKLATSLIARTWSRATTSAGSSATSTSRRASRDASARPIRTIRSGVEYASIVQRAAAIIGSAIFLVIAPGTLALYVPWYLTHWHFAPALFPIARVLGGALIVAGLPILLD